ncbi:hypothetical protein AVEN_229213-1 [Araneus ventricosus]|uniref:Uncharacterized protein n=1 Tax=Araneus ventricosus TaxID=182803 RepID=A0A4Y2SA56_ARAVE|nr:hypothetical protein AVEN_229213-1 [Araneus ventricosus]
MQKEFSSCTKEVVTNHSQTSTDRHTWFHKKGILESAKDFIGQECTETLMSCHLEVTAPFHRIGIDLSWTIFTICSWEQKDHHQHIIRVYNKQFTPEKINLVSDRMKTVRLYAVCEREAML